MASCLWQLHVTTEWLSCRLSGSLDDGVGVLTALWLFTCNLLFFALYFGHLEFLLLICSDGSTPDRQQSKRLLTIHKCGSKITRNSALDCHLSPVGFHFV